MITDPVPPEDPEHAIMEESCERCGGPVEEIHEVFGPSAYFMHRCTNCGSEEPYGDFA